MGKKRVIAETGAGQHGVATATAAAHFGLECEIFMGAEDVRRQRLNVFRMELLGARVNVVESGSRTLKDATNEAMRNWMETVEDTHYILGSVVGPHPFPMIVRDLQSVIGRECTEQCREAFGHLPEAIVACVGGGSNAAGIFYPFIDDEGVKCLGVEAGGLHGSLSYVLQDDFGQTAPVHSCSAGLDYPGVGPEHSYWKDAGLVEYTSVSDEEALDAFALLSRLEGIVPALEPSHAIAAAVKRAGSMKPDEVLVINLSGRGDKDVQQVARLTGQGRDCFHCARSPLQSACGSLSGPLLYHPGRSLNTFASHAMKARSSSMARMRVCSAAATAARRLRGSAVRRTGRPCSSSR